MKGEKKMKFKYLDFKKRALILNLCLGYSEINDVDFFIKEGGLEGVHVIAGSIEDDTYSVGVAFVDSTSDMEILFRDVYKAILDAIEGYYSNLDDKEGGKE